MKGWEIILMAIVILIPIIPGCNRQESNDNPNEYVLTADDFFIKGLYYQADSATVVKAIGTPDSIKIITLSERYPGGLSIWKYPDFSLYLNTMKALVAIKMNHAGFLTAKGLGVGDSLNRIWELYGYSDRDYGLPFAGFSYYVNYNDTTCIHFETEDGLVKSIYVGRMF